MSTPKFDFTDRARPVIQFGRSERRMLGDAIWQEARWGEGRWNVVDWQVLWTDLECDVHEISTKTGRGGATDRFVPGTANIVASNVHQISDMIFPPVPDTDEGFEYVPQPPIEHEEDLQAPNATTVVSNGWNFTDDFETSPRWRFPPAWSGYGTTAAPAGPFKVELEGMTPECYIIAGGATTNYAGHAAAQWTGGYDPADNTFIEIVLADIDWPTATSSGTPRLVVDLMVRMDRDTRECYCARFILTPNFSGPNGVQSGLFHMGPNGEVIDGEDGSSDTPETVGTGTNGIFGTRVLRAEMDYSGAFTGSFSGAFSLTYSGTTPLDGQRIGVAMRYEQGGLPNAREKTPRVAAISGPDFVDDLSFPLGAGWTLPTAFRRSGYNPMRQIDGAMVPTQTFHASNDEYAGVAFAQWASNFEGDQYLEMEVSNVSKPRPNGRAGGSAVWFDIYTHGGRSDVSGMVTRIAYDPAYGTNDNKIWWQMWRQDQNGAIIEYDPEVYDEISLGATNGVMPEHDVWRVESDEIGEQRLYRNGHLLQTVMSPNPTFGGRIGIHVNWEADNLFPNGQRRPDVVRIDRLSAGLQSPLGTEELGCWIRIGVDHDTLGKHWFFRGFVDAVEPTYEPGELDTVRIECVDSLGEAGRVEVDGDQMSNPFMAAPQRIYQILNQASWPRYFRRIEDDSTIMSRPSSGKAVDALTQVAESCGGAVYGDPDTGDIVFKGMDWQGRTASDPPSAFLTNYHPLVDDGLTRVCPAGWERSSRRQDMNTRVRFSTETSNTPDGDPYVTEWRHKEAEALYGVEKYDQEVIATTLAHINDLAIRQLRLRSPAQFPRIEAALLDAATGDDALDLMTTVSFTGPTKLWCQHHIPTIGFVFNRKMLVTGVEHQMSPDAWTCRLALDPSSVFYEVGGRWGSTAQPEARWGVDEWGRTR